MTRLLWQLGLAVALQSCAVVTGWDCVETPGYCKDSEVCDSLTRRCEKKCNAHPPRSCPEGTACNYASGTCRPWCRNDSRTTEQICYDSADDDCDGLADCADPDCDRLGCGPGCVCGKETRREVLCNDGADNNSDGLIDCADPNCVGVVCRAATGACDVPEVCLADHDTCPANQVHPSTSVCRAAAGACDVEEKCTGRDVDCPENAFGGASTICRPASGPCDVADSCLSSTGVCSADVKRADGLDCGTGCACRGGAPTESDCRDRADNDGDGLSDCADVTDCPAGAACNRPTGADGQCRAGTCQ